MWPPPAEKSVSDDSDDMPNPVVHASSADHEAEMRRLRKQASELQSARDRITYLASAQQGKGQQQQAQFGKGGNGGNDKNKGKKNNRKRPRNSGGD